MKAHASVARVVRVSVEGLDKRYGRVEALRAVSVDFDAGKLTAILGPSGCGKTTLLRALAGFLAVDGGTIRFDAEVVTTLPPQARGTAMVFQSYALWPHMTVFDNVAYGLRMKRVAADAIRTRVRDALALVEIGDVDEMARRRPAALSGGQQQRVALARALVVEPRVLLLDEPLSNLDAKVRQRLRVEVRRLQRRVGITAIHVTHDQEEALAIADRVVLMDAGRSCNRERPRTSTSSRQRIRRRLPRRRQLARRPRGGGCARHRRPAARVDRRRARARDRAHPVLGSHARPGRGRARAPGCARGEHVPRFVLPALCSSG